MSGIATITEASIGTKDRACVDVCPAQCIYEFDPVHDVLFSEVEARSRLIENSHVPNADAVATFGPSISCSCATTSSDAAPCSTGCCPRRGSDRRPTPPSCSTKSSDPASRPC